MSAPTTRLLRRFVSSVGLGASILLAGGCSSTSRPFPTLPVTPQAVYWTLYSSGTPSTTPQISFAALPLTNGSVPTELDGNSNNQLSCSNAATFDAQGRLWVVSYSSSCNSGTERANVFVPPISTSSAPTLTFTFPESSPEVVSLAFDGSGNLWATDYTNGTLTKYAGPFTTSGALTASITLSGITQAEGVAIDAAGNVYASSQGNGVIDVYHAPITSSSTPTTLTLSTPVGLAFDAHGNLYAASATGNGSLNRFNSSNLGNGATPDIVDTTGLTNSFGSNLAFDSAGNLYYADCGSLGFVREYPLATSTFSTSLAPTVAFTDAAIVNSDCVWGIAVR